MGKGYRKYLRLYLIIGALLVPNLAHGANWYVDSGASPGGDGTSWSQAFPTIQQAVNAATFVWAICNSPPDTIHVREGTYQRTTPININRYVTILGGYNYKGVRNWKNYPTIITGLHVSSCLNITRPCILDGFIIQNGVGDGSGGGMYIDSTPVYCSTYDYYHVPKIKNCIIENNRASNLLPGKGGGIYDIGSNTRFENCIFQGNSAGKGGGACHDYSSIIFEKCTFRDNLAMDLGGGGAIAGDWNNTVTGGLVYIINCLFYGNESSTKGGAIRYNAVFPRIWNSTFFENTAVSSGGAYFGFYYADGPNVRNSIFWGNSPDQLDVVCNETHYVSQSCIQDGWTGPGRENTNENPKFESPTTGDFHLTLGSPCIDSGYRFGMPSEDIEGVLRPHDGNASGTAEWDMGAYEFALTTIPGDFDWDWDVDGHDLPGFGISFGSHLGDEGYNASYDFDADRAINENDLEILADAFGQVETP